MSSHDSEKAIGILEHIVNRARISLTSDKSKIVDYMIKYDLRDYFGKSVPEEEKQRRRISLEEKVGQSVTKYEGELGGIARKTATKGSMALAVANDIYGYVSNVPLANVTGLGYALFAAKTIAEVPAMYRYMKKSHDWYGFVGHYALKPVRYLLPVIGPALESGAFERMVRKQVRSEAKVQFIKEFGEYETAEERENKILKMPVSEAIYLPAEKRKAA